MAKPSIIILSSSPLTDRILLYTNFLSIIAEECDVAIWAGSHPGIHWKAVQHIAEVSSIPPTRDFREVPTNYIRRVNDMAWAYANDNPSKLSMMRHLRDPQGGLVYKSQKAIARLIAKGGCHRLLERWLRAHIAGRNTSPQAEAKFKLKRSAFFLSMGPHFHPQMLVTNAAVRCGVPVGAFITSWDNITTKTRLDHSYNAYFVWSEEMKQDLLAEEPGAAGKVYVTGAPQFDLLLRKTMVKEREEACRAWKLRPELPIILYAMGRANGVDERYIAGALARMVAGGELGKVQLLVRPHPFFETREIATELEVYGSSVRVQRASAAGGERRYLPVHEEDIVEWVNSFYHAAVVVHLSSTAAIDAALLGRPSVCINYDPAPGAPKDKLIKEVNSKWVHYRRVAESGGTKLAANSRSLAEAIEEYLERPQQDAKKREEMARRVAGFVDGRSAQRLALAVIEAMHGKA